MADPHAACAAIAALPDLHSLTLAQTWDVVGATPIQALQNPSKLSHLSLEFSGEDRDPVGDEPREFVEQLWGLPALTNLQQLQLANIPDPGVPGGVPAELSKFTSLSMKY